MDNGTSSTVLVLTYEFPPAAGSGVQRIAKLCKFLPDSGIVPHVVCAEPPPGHPVDHSLDADVRRAEVTRLAARDPARAISRMMRPAKTVRSRLRPSRTGNVGASAASPGVPASIRVARLISDDDASFWARSAVSAGVRVGRAAEVGAVLASGPTFSVLVAGARVAEQLGVPLVADMRDGWLTNPGTPSEGRRAERARRHQRLVMDSASVVTCVSGPIAEEATAAGARRVEIIPNGFDAEEMPAWDPVADATVRVGFMGRFYGLTDPAPFLRGLAEALAAASGQAPDVRLEVVGPPSERLDAVADALGVTEQVIHHGLLPHDEALALMARMDVGLVTIADVPGADAVYTTKLFEYLGMGLPVLVVGPGEGAAADLVCDAGAGWTVNPADTGALAELLRGLSVEKRGAGRVTTKPDLSIIKTFERRAQAERFATMISEER